MLLLLSWISTVLVSYVFKEILLFVITTQKTNFKYFSNNKCYFIFTDVTEIFSAYAALIVFVGNQIIILFLFYHVGIFTILGLYKSEYENLVFISKTFFFLFFFSILIFNKMLFLSSMDFFLGFKNFLNLKSLTLHFEAKLNEYINFYFKFYYICIFYFQIFTLLVFFINYVNNKLKIVQQFRRFFYYIFAILATFFTPPDAFAQTILCCSIIISYEILVFYIILKKI